MSSLCTQSVHAPTCYALTTYALSQGFVHYRYYSYSTVILSLCGGRKGFGCEPAASQTSSRHDTPVQKSHALCLRRFWGGGRTRIGPLLPSNLGRFINVGNSRQPKRDARHLEVMRTATRTPEAPKQKTQASQQNAMAKTAARPTTGPNYRPLGVLGGLLPKTTEQTTICETPNTPRRGHKAQRSGTLVQS